MPQAPAWNIGTIGRTQSCGPIAIPAIDVTPSALRKVDRCVYGTPLGRPVVPMCSRGHHLVLVDGGRFVDIRLVGDEVLVTEDAVEVSISRRLGALSSKSTTWRTDGIRSRMAATVGKEVGVDEQHLVTGVVDDVREVAGDWRTLSVCNTRRLQGAGEVQLEMAAAVPRQRADPRRLPDIQAIVRVHQLLRARCHGAVGRAIGRAVGGARHDLVLGEAIDRLGEDEPDAQRDVHHEVARLSVAAALAAARTSSPSARLQPARRRLRGRAGAGGASRGCAPPRQEAGRRSDR